MTAILSNNGVSKLAGSLSAADTSLSVTSGTGSKFAVPSAGTWFPLTLIKATGELEIVRCTARVGDLLTIVRAQEGTAATTFSAGDRVEQRFTAAVLADINATVNQAIADMQAAIAGLNLTGAIVPFGMNEANAGWLRCNGAAVSRTTYAALFAKIGTTYGIGDGTTTFVVPDLRGETIRGWDDGRGIDTGRVLGSSQAAQNLAHNHTASADAQGSHNHTGVTDTQGYHSHGGIVTDGNLVNANGFEESNGWPNYNMIGIPGAGAHAHNLYINSGGSHAHNITIASSGGADMRVRNVAALYCIKY